MDDISFDQWKKLDLRIGEIVDVHDHPNADRLYVMTVDLGGEKRTLVAGLKHHYEKDELVGKKIVVFTNLKPVELRGVMSQGMVLAAVEESDEEHIVLLSPEEDIANGAQVR